MGAIWKKVSHIFNTGAKLLKLGNTTYLQFPVKPIVYEFSMVAHLRKHPAYFFE